MSAVAGDQYVAVVVDGGSKYRPVLFWQIHRIRQQRIAGTHATDFDPVRHRIQHGKTARCFCGQITPRLLEYISICPKLMSSGLGESEQFSYRAISPGCRKKDVCIQKYPHCVSATWFACPARRPARPQPLQIHAGAHRYITRWAG